VVLFVILGLKTWGCLCILLGDDDDDGGGTDCVLLVLLFSCVSILFRSVNLAVVVVAVSVGLWNDEDDRFR